MDKKTKVKIDYAPNTTFKDKDGSLMIMNLNASGNNFIQYSIQHLFGGYSKPLPTEN